MTEPRELRERLVTGLRADGALHDARVAAALADVPRHKFLPGIDPGRAYADDAVVTKVDADGRPISSSSQPAIMALMLEQLDVQPGHRVLEIGAGTGYNAALLAHLAGGSGEVTTLDLDDDIVAAAREHLAACGYDRVRVVRADGGNGWPPGAPYDRIILTVGAWDIAPAWAGQLSPRGRLVLPLALRAGIQYSIAFEQAGDHLDSVSVLPCGFMRLRGAFAGPETIVPLGRRTGMLAESDPRPADAEDLESLLAQPGRIIGTGVRVMSMDLYGGLGLWLAAREPGLGRLSVFGVAGPGRAPPPRPRRRSRAARHGHGGQRARVRRPGTDERSGRHGPGRAAHSVRHRRVPVRKRRRGTRRPAGRPRPRLGRRRAPFAGRPAGQRLPGRGRAARRAAGHRHRQAAHPAGAGLAGLAGLSPG